MGTPVFIPAPVLLTVHFAILYATLQVILVCIDVYIFIIIHNVLHMTLGKSQEVAPGFQTAFIILILSLVIIVIHLVPFVIMKDYIQ